MQITLQVEQALAVALQLPDKHLQKVRPLNDVLAKVRASLEPRHPGRDTDFSRYFTVSVADSEGWRYGGRLKVKSG